MDINNLTQNLVLWGAQFGMRLLGALVVWIVGRRLIDFSVNLMLRTLRRQSVEPTILPYAGSAVAVALNIMLVVAILGYFGVETTTFAALAAAIGIAIGAAWSGLLANFAAGAFLLILRPFKTGDFIAAGGTIGTVEEIGLFVTAINTMDNVRTYVGNNKVLSDTVQNFSANPYRRVDLVAQLNHGVNVGTAIDLLKERLARIPNVKTTPPPDVEILTFTPLGPVLAVHAPTATTTTTGRCTSTRTGRSGRPLATPASRPPSSPSLSGTRLERDGTTRMIRGIARGAGHRPRRCHMRTLAACLLLLVVGLTHPAGADEILFKNGDRLTGTITQGAGGKVTIKTEAAGDVTVDLTKVKTFSTDNPVQLKVGEKTVITTPVAAGGEGTVQVAPQGLTGPAQTVKIADVMQINPPPAQWTGTLALNGMFETGNSNSQTVGFTASATRRTDDDRISFGAQYLYGRQEDPDTGEKNTTTNNWFVTGRYDYFFTKQFYGLAGIRLEGDEIADLKIRVSPTVGVGYQWYEGPTFNLATEAGPAYVYEDYTTTGNNDYFAARLAYRIDGTPRPGVFLFHGLEYLPSFEDPGKQFLINADAGVRFTLISKLFSEFKIEWKHNQAPAPGREKDDFRFLVGVGWAF